MFGSLRWVAALGLAALMLVGGSAYGQRRSQGVVPRPIPKPPAPQLATPRTSIGTPAPPNIGGFPINPNPFISPTQTLGQAAFNTAVLGRALNSTIPPIGTGFNPFLGGLGTTGPVLSSGGFGAAGGFNPFLGGGGGAVLSTGGGVGGGYNLSTAGGYTPYGAGSLAGLYDPTAATMQGLASLTDATGKYWISIQQARLLREDSRRSALDTARKEIEYERWRLSQMPTAQTMRDAEMKTELERARRDPPPTEVWSGKSLNELLRSIQNGKLNTAASPTLEEDTLKQINLSDNNSRGNVGMLKQGKLSWPLSLQEKQFDKARKDLSRNLWRLVDQLKDKEPLDSALLKDVNADFKALNTILNDGADDLSPAQYIEAKRYLNSLGLAIKALSDSKVANYFNNTWNAKGKTAAELVNHMTKEGLTFAPAAPGDEAAYTALYHALRSYEANLQTAAK